MSVIEWWLLEMAMTFVCGCSLLSGCSHHTYDTFIVVVVIVVVVMRWLNFIIFLFRLTSFHSFSVIRVEAFIHSIRVFCLHNIQVCRLESFLSKIKVFCLLFIIPGIALTQPKHTLLKCNANVKVLPICMLHQHCSCLCFYVQLRMWSNDCKGIKAKYHLKKKRNDAQGVTANTNEMVNKDYHKT